MKTCQVPYTTCRLVPEEKCFTVPRVTCRYEPYTVMTKRCRLVPICEPVCEPICPPAPCYSPVSHSEWFARVHNRHTCCK
jgi:hypothetical protein